MKLIRTKIPDLIIIEPTIFEDERGWFFETFNKDKFHVALHELGLPASRPFIQDNHSCSKKNVLRGLHFQNAPYAQGKLVRVIRGAVYDVAVDIRKESATFGQYVAVELNQNNKRMFWIPEGFAHGFLTLEDDTHFLYKTTGSYHKASELSIRWDDPYLSIDWPLSNGPILNEKDNCASFFNEIKQVLHHESK